MKHPVCPNCQGRTKGKRGVPLPYCSTRCYNKAHGITKVCANPDCNKVFVPMSEVNSYCSSRCQSNVRRKRSRERPKAENATAFRIFQRDNFKCVYCGDSSYEGARLHIDHVYPQSKGGKNDLINLVTACSRCNTQKNDMMLTQEQIISLWKRNAILNERFNLTASYEELKVAFDKKFKR